MDLGLSQRQAARQIGVRRETLQQWEDGEFDPTVSCLPKVLRFLGRDPRPEPDSLPEWLVWYRAGRGLSQEAMAREIGVSPRTLWLWETGKRRPMGENLVKLSELCGAGSHPAIG